jgi:sulfur relay protein TusB/DsrH
MEEWMPRLDSNDAVLLLQDGVIALQAGPSGVGEALAGHTGRVHALKADVVARGLDPGGTILVDDAGAVELIARFDRVVAL